MRRRVLFGPTLALFISLTLSACGSEPPATALTIRVENGFGGHTYRLWCDPPRGSAPYPERICARLADHAEDMLFGAKNPVCIGGVGTPHIRVRGQYRGRPVDEPDLCGDGSTIKAHETAHVSSSASGMTVSFDKLMCG